MFESVDRLGLVHFNVSAAFTKLFVFVRAPDSRLTRKQQSNTNKNKTSINAKSKNAGVL